MKLQILLLAVMAALLLVLGGCGGETKNPYEGEILICLDAGHGGDDSGAVLGQRLEKDDNLRMALAVGAELEAKGAAVIYTRGDDTFVELLDRANYANEQGRRSSCPSIGMPAGDRGPRSGSTSSPTNGKKAWGPASRRGSPRWASPTGV